MREICAKRFKNDGRNFDKYCKNGNSKCSFCVEDLIPRDISLSLSEDRDHCISDLKEAFLRSVFTGDRLLFSCLVEHFEKIQFRSFDGWNLIARACQAGHVEMLADLVRIGADVNEFYGDGVCGIYQACRSGDMKMLDKLIELGLDLKRPFGQFCVLKFAFMYNNVKILERLVAAGASLRCENELGCDCWLLRGTVNKSYWEMHYKLIELGVDMNRTDKSTGRTVLHLVCKLGIYKSVEKLLAAGAELEISNRKGQTALHVACLYRRTEIASLLIRSGANVNAKDKHRRTPMMLALRVGNEKLVETLHEQFKEHIKEQSILRIKEQVLQQEQFK